MANAKRTDDRDLELGDDLVITTTTRRVSGGGTWVNGTIADHRFQALVFPEHADCPEFELGDSRISKLWLQRIADKATVLNFDRGWDVRPTDATATAVMDFLAAGLADHVYHA
jgi:hypothetical protein